MAYTVKRLIAELQELEKANPNSLVTVVEEKRREVERKERHSVPAHNPVIDVERLGSTILLTYRA